RPGGGHRRRRPRHRPARGPAQPSRRHLAAVRIDIVTIFPDFFGPVDSAGQVGASGPLGVLLIGKAAARGDIDFRVHDLRRWTTDIHLAVDDSPFGGGPGMVMKPDVWGAALDEVLAEAAAAAADTAAASAAEAPTT